MDDDHYISAEERAIIRDAELVFRDVPYPGDDNIVINPNYWENIELLIEFEGKHWKEISVDLAHAYRQSLMAFTPAGFLFYFPAFLIKALGDPDGADIGNFICYAFIPSFGEQKMETFVDRTKLFNSEQLAVVKRYLRHFKNDIPQEYRQRTLEYWKIDDE